MSPAKRQLAWSFIWVSACAALAAARTPQVRLAILLAAVAAAAGLRAALRNRSAYLALAVGVGLLGLTAASVSNLTAPSLAAQRIAPALGAMTIAFLVATLADGLARRRGLAYRTLVAATLAVPVAWAVILLVAYAGLSTARIPLILVKIPLPDPLGRAFEIARVVFQPWVALSLVCASIAGLRATRSA